MAIGPLTIGVGAEILGVDLARPPDDDMIRALPTALLDHVVIFFREQTLMPHEL